MPLVGLLIWLIVVCVIVWAARAILNAFAIGDPIRTIVMVVIVILVLFALLNALGYGGLGSLGAVRVPRG